MTKENKNIFLILVVSILVLLILYPVVENRIVTKVIDKLKKEYSPGPYAPGFDPNKIDTDFFNNNNDNSQPTYHKVPYYPSPEDWNKTWQK
jgi:hypothetical protein